MRKVNDWDAKSEMNKHVIDWMCKKWDDWDAKSKMNAKNSDFERDEMILMNQLRSIFSTYSNWWKYDWIVQKMLSLVRMKNLTSTIDQSCTVCMMKRMNSISANQSLYLY